MQTKIGYRALFGNRIVGPLALAAVLVVPAGSFAQAAQTQIKVSDAQVEANVLKAFAGDSRLANQPINTSTVFGTVTLTGSVGDETARNAAEQIASHTDGVKKVVDQLTVGAAPAQTAAAGQNANGADYDPAAQNSLPGSMPASQAQAQVPATADPNNGNVAPGMQAPQYDQQGSQQQGYPQQQAQGQPPYDQQQGGYPQQQGGPQGQPQGAPQGNYQTAPNGRLYRRDYERQLAMQQAQQMNQQNQQQGYAQGQQGYAQQPAQGNPGGVQVTVPDGSVLAVSINHWMSSGKAQPGSAFTAIVAQDVLAGGQIAIPRGATVDGTVVDAKGAGALNGRGELTLQLNTLEMGGQRIPLQSDEFTVHGHDKTAQSVGSTIVGAGVGALFGAALGGGVGAAVGAGVGGAAGLGASAATNNGQANIPPEALLHFRLTAPLPVVTVSEMEMQRLGGYAGPSGAYRGEPGPRPAGYVGPAVGVGVYAAPYPAGYRPGYYYRGGYWYHY